MAWYGHDADEGTPFGETAWWRDPVVLLALGTLLVVVLTCAGELYAAGVLPGTVR